ncbi:MULTISPECIES: hypothetical protein [Psychrobacter]|uniref:hypothetical protein n=1 Tax=Psychrobacter TaxID=497 RepID=UPI00191913F8|nr:MULTISPECIES: hypothetical protein [Psychrobacter]
MSDMSKKSDYVEDFPEENPAGDLNEKPKSKYELCVAAESAKVHALIAKAQSDAKARLLDDK